MAGEVFQCRLSLLGQRVIRPELAEEILRTWLETPFKGGEHQRRIEQIAALERGGRLTKR